MISFKTNCFKVKSIYQLEQKTTFSINFIKRICTCTEYVPYFFHQNVLTTKQKKQQKELNRSNSAFNVFTYELFGNGAVVLLSTSRCQCCYMELKLHHEVKNP